MMKSRFGLRIWLVAAIGLLLLTFWLLRSALAMAPSIAGRDFCDLPLTTDLLLLVATVALAGRVASGHFRSPPVAKGDRWYRMAQVSGTCAAAARFSLAVSQGGGIIWYLVFSSQWVLLLVGGVALVVGIICAFPPVSSPITHITKPAGQIVPQTTKSCWKPFSRALLLAVFLWWAVSFCVCVVETWVWLSNDSLLIGAINSLFISAGILLVLEGFPSISVTEYRVAFWRALALLVGTACTMAYWDWRWSFSRYFPGGLALPVVVEYVLFGVAASIGVWMTATRWLLWRLSRPSGL